MLETFEEDMHAHLTQSNQFVSHHLIRGKTAEVGIGSLIIKVPKLHL